MIFDCIEFNKRFRIADILEDIAFLFMDLEYRGRFDLSKALSDVYFGLLGDGQDVDLLRFYKIYRAVVRGKIEGFTADGIDDGAARQKALRMGRDYFDLARYYLDDCGRPFNPVVLMGVSGSGKSAIGKELFPGAVIIRSDEVRKELAGLPADKHMYVEWGKEIYSREMTERIYREIADRAVAAGREGRRVVVDATFIGSSERAQLYEKCCDSGLNPFFIRCFTDTAVLRERIGARMADSRDVSDADIAVMERQLEVAEEPLELPSFRVLEIDTDEDLETIRRALRSFL
jgi:hypothetical protein